MLPRQWVLLRQWQRRRSLEIEVFELVERAQVGQEAPELLVIQQVVAAEGQGGRLSRAPELRLPVHI